MIAKTNDQLKQAIIQVLLEKPMSLADLSQSLDNVVSLPTLRRALNELIDADWVRRKGQSSSGGRPATLFAMNSYAHIIIGVHVEIPTVNMVVVRSDGEVIHQHHVTLPDSAIPDEAVRVITDYVHDVEQMFAVSKIIGLAVASPGYLSTATGEILFVGRAPGWENYPIVKRLKAELNMPIILEGGTDCMIRVEVDHFDDAQDIVYLAVLEGVKVSMILNGSLYRGPFVNAGIIGRMKIAPQSKPNVFENYYDLEETSSVAGVTQTFQSRMKSVDLDDTLRKIQEEPDRNARFHAILHAAEDGHPLCVEIVDRMFDDLSLAVSNMLLLLQPHILVIGGQLSMVSHQHKSRLEREIRSKLPTLLNNYLMIKFARITGRYAAAIGATRWFFERYLSEDAAFATDKASS